MGCPASQSDWAPQNRSEQLAERRGRADVEDNAVIGHESCLGRCPVGPADVGGLELRDRVWLDPGISRDGARQPEAHRRPELGVREPDSPAVGLDDRP
jgi:hypothetical protein